MKNVADLFYEQAARNPHKEAIFCEGRSLNYEEFSALTARFSNFLLDSGVEKGDHIGLVSPNSVEFVALIFACADIGAALVPLYPSLPTDAILRAVRVSDVKHFIANEATYKKIGDLSEFCSDGAKICLDWEIKGATSFSNLNNYPATRPNVVKSGEEALVLTMTSGSTGEPKPILLTQKNKLDRALAHISLYGVTSEDRILAATPLYHSLAERLAIMPLISGATSLLMNRFTPALWLKTVSEQRASFTIAVSSQLIQISNLIGETDYDLNSLRLLVSSSAPLQEQTKAALFEKLKCDFHEMYGASEISTATDIDFIRARNKQKSVGKPLPCASVKILRENGDESGCDEIGEIAVKTTLLCKSYYKMDFKFESCLKDGYFRTGDLGRLDEDGYLYYCGRIKELIITGGINVYPADVEECAMELPWARECAAFAYPDERLGEVVAVAVAPKEIDNSNLKSNLKQLRFHFLERLPSHAQPRKIFFVAELPKNAMGKIKRGELLEYVKKEALA